MTGEQKSRHRTSRIRPVRADDYAEPLAGMIRRGEIEPPDVEVIDDPAPVACVVDSTERCWSPGYCDLYGCQL
jgi:hypothetical protein